MKEDFEEFLLEQDNKRILSYTDETDIEIDMISNDVGIIVHFLTTLTDAIESLEEEKPITVYIQSKTLSKRFLLSSIDIPFNISFSQTKFSGGIDFAGSTFRGNIRFHECDFHFTNFQNTTFEKLADFYKSKFLDDATFSLTDFLDRAIFSEVEFHHCVLFIYNKLGTNTFISFERTFFKKGVDLSRSNFNNGDLQFFGMILGQDRVGELLKHHFYVNSEDDPIQVSKNFRVTYRLIKHEHRKTNNTIEALRYQYLELSALRHELKLKKTYRFWTKRYWRIKQDRLSLALNRISNSYGTNWLRAFFFTLISAFIFLVTYYLIFRFDANIDEFPSMVGVINSYLYLLVLTKWDFQGFYSEYCNYEPRWVLSWLFIARLIIGYGIYQFIQAFRRLSKN